MKTNGKAGGTYRDVTGVDEDGPNADKDDGRKDNETEK